MLEEYLRQLGRLRFLTPSNVLFILLALLGSFSIYMASFSYPLPVGIKLLIDSTTIASMAMEFYLIVVTGLVATRVASVFVLWFLVGTYINVKTSRARRSSSISARRLLVSRFIRRKQRTLRVAFFVIIVSLLFFEIVRAAIFIVSVGLASICAARVVPLLFKKYQRGKAFKDALILLQVCVVSMICWQAGLSKWKQSRTEEVMLETSVESARYALLFINSSGMVFESVSSTSPDGVRGSTVFFVPYSEIRRVTGIEGERVPSHSD